MDVRHTVSHWSIEGVGGVLILVSLVFVGLDDVGVVVDTIEVFLPILLACAVIAFGRWLNHTTPQFDDHHRLLVALGHLLGGVLLVVVTGWILFVVSLKANLPEELIPILLNGFAVGFAGTGVLVALYLRHQLRTEQVNSQNKRLEGLASIVSHDLRSPLQVAHGRLDLAQETGDAEHFAAVSSSLNRMEVLISDMLALTQQTQNIDETSPTSLGVVARSAWSNVATDEIDLLIEQTAQVEADGNRLVQAFENLFRNAIEHAGEGVTTVCVGTLDSSGFYVEDDGVGIPVDDRDAVFDAGVTGTSDGTGLGLAIVKEIIEAHGWDIEVTDSKSGGARFEITRVEFAE